MVKSALMRPARFLCMCGVVHELPRERAMEGIGVAWWRCTDCRRLFVLTHDPPNTFEAIFVDPGVREKEIRETGPGKKAPSPRQPMPPPAIEFQCRCGRKLVAHAWMFNTTFICPSCGITLYLALKYSYRRARHVIVPEYPIRA